jgi:hypothetical protein
MHVVPSPGHQAANPLVRLADLERDIGKLTKSGMWQQTYGFLRSPVLEVAANKARPQLHGKAKIVGG